jgi:hypothetical protein
MRPADRLHAPAQIGVFFQHGSEASVNLCGRVEQVAAEDLQRLL